MKKIFILFSIVFVGGLGAGVYFSFVGQDLTDVRGRHETDKAARVVDVPAMIENAAKSRENLVITEQEMNTWLGSTMKVKQEGLFSDQVDLKGVWLRFEEGQVEIVVERDIKGLSHTVSMYVTVERKKKGDKTVANIERQGGKVMGMVPCGGRFGKVRVPIGFTLMTRKMGSNLEKLFDREFELIGRVMKKAGAWITLEEDQMRINFPKMP